MRIATPSPDIIRTLKRKQRDWQVGFHVGYRAGIFKQPHHRSVDGGFIPHEGRKANSGVKPTDDDGVLEGDGDASEWAGEVDRVVGLGRWIGEPFLGRGEEDLGETVGFGVGFEGELAVGAEDGERGGGTGVHRGHEVGDGLGEDGAVWGGHGSVVGWWEGGDAGGALGLLEATVPPVLEVLYEEETHLDIEGDVMSDVMSDVFKRCLVRWLTAS